VLPINEEGVCTVGFIGSYSHPPNVEALVWLIEEIVPAVSERKPNVQFLVAGRNPPESIVKRAPRNVQFLGFVETLPAFYKQCSVVIAPLLSGGGVKIKVAEALSFGKPVVTTSVGVEGMNADDGVHLIVADATGPFVEAIIRLLQDVGLREQLTLAATKLSAEQFSVEHWLARCKKLLGMAPSVFARVR
jgi:glycosyltransferase involved in cell wall biosynthesis